MLKASQNSLLILLKYLKSIKFSSHFKDNISSSSQVILNIYLYNNIHDNLLLLTVIGNKKIYVRIELTYTLCVKWIFLGF
tara:strand:- start:566 stop:805 length:240 start_codon:yes stop_codon:yes gene_type:complete